MSIFKPSSTENTRTFYERLNHGDNHLGIWGKESRFDADSVAAKPSVLNHFVPNIERYVRQSDKCLDLGCGPGAFLSLLAPLCASIVGADVVRSFADECESMIIRKKIANGRVVLLEGNLLPFADGEFDTVVMVDTIHHLEDIKGTLQEVSRVLKPNGLFLIFEPNKLNPLLALLCALDKNEHGLLRLGTFAAYRQLLEASFRVEFESYNGMLVGPSGRLAVTIADGVSSPHKPLLNWLSPKLFIVARKNSLCP